MGFLLKESHNIRMKIDDRAKIQKLGIIDIEAISSEFGSIQTNEIIITNERLNHILKKHPQDFELFQEYIGDIIQLPDFVIKDLKHSGTVFMIKKITDTNLNVVIRIALAEDVEGLKNSVMTCYRIRDSNLKKLLKNNKLLYKKE